MSKKTLIVSGGIILSLVLLTLLIGGSYEGLKRIIEHVRYRYLFAAVGSAICAYIFMGLSLREVLRLLGHEIAAVEAVCIVFVATTANYFVSSMGVSGFALAPICSKNAMSRSRSR